MSGLQTDHGNTGGTLCLVAGYDDDDSNNDNNDINDAADRLLESTATCKSSAEQIPFPQVEMVIPGTQQCSTTTTRHKLTSSKVVQRGVKPSQPGGNENVAAELKCKKSVESVDRNDTVPGNAEQPVADSRRGITSEVSVLPDCGVSNNKRQKTSLQVLQQSTVHPSRSSQFAVDSSSAIVGDSIGHEPSSESSSCTYHYHVDESSAQTAMISSVAEPHPSEDVGPSNSQPAEAAAAPKSVWSREAFAFQSTPVAPTCGAYSARRGAQPPHCAYLFRTPARAPPPPPPPIVPTSGAAVLPRGREWRGLQLLADEEASTGTAHINNFGGHNQRSLFSETIQCPTVFSVSSDDLRDPNWTGNPAASEPPRSRKGGPGSVVSTPIYQPQTNSVATVLEPSRRQRQKHQINWLAQVALDQASSTSSATANQYATRRSAQTKYGW